MRANRSGKIAESVIEGLLRSHQCSYTRQCPVGVSIYRTTLRADFVVHDFADYPDGLAIEVKWQDSGGSVDEKFPYLITNAKEQRYARPLLLIAFGPGLRRGALDWVRAQVDGTALIAVLTIEEFMSWLQRHTRTTNSH